MFDSEVPLHTTLLSRKIRLCQRSGMTIKDNFMTLLLNQAALIEVSETLLINTQNKIINIFQLQFFKVAYIKPIKQQFSRKNSLLSMKLNLKRSIMELFGEEVVKFSESKQKLFKEYIKDLETKIIKSQHNPELKTEIDQIFKQLDVDVVCRFNQDQFADTNSQCSLNQYVKHSPDKNFDMTKQAPKKTLQFKDMNHINEQIINARIYQVS
ncbi:Hypothetical_protein [Hexamita inflata]|uniref:Hypothetical_protein n=1 Tax=Hexamita inflata TaxID=28002 RepID=A0AA86R4E4_9EUKA|nr:Hypothetical protein HINF_LOCUS57950 [Hexamita inflata]